MRATPILLGCSIAAATALLISRLPGDDATGKEVGDPGSERPLGVPQDWDEIKKSISSYAAAYNKHDAKRIGLLYAETAELKTATGTVFQGRKNIAAEYAAFFKEHVDARIEIDVISIRFVSPTLAIEDGTTVSRLSKNGSPHTSRYVAVHVKTNGRWLLASVRDEGLPEKPKDNLEDLNWLIGRWVDEAPESLMEVDCYWHPSGAYLMRDFQIKVKGLLASKGTERIGWDPLRQQIRSWLFDTDGGYLEGAWVRHGKKWVVTARGFRADGRPIQATYVVTSLRKDAYHMTSTDRTVGGDRLGNIDMTIVRRAPLPGKTPGLKRNAPRKNSPANN